MAETSDGGRRAAPPAAGSPGGPGQRSPAQRATKPRQPPPSRRTTAGLVVPAGLALLGLVLTLAALGGPSLRARLAGGGAEAVRESVQSALVRGNQLARRGQPEAAVEAYREGWPGLPAAGATAGPAAALAYNLGTTYHRLERLPEALLWYRRAQILAPADPWLEDNLELVRAELAAARFPAPGVSGQLALRPVLAPAGAVLLAWLALLLWLLRPRLERRARRPAGEALARHAWAVVACTALLTWAAGAALVAWGPRPAVLLDPCGPELAAGSEVWVRPVGALGGDGGWTVPGASPDAVADPVCPEPAVAQVETD